MPIKRAILYLSILSRGNESRGINQRVSKSKFRILNPLSDFDIGKSGFVKHRQIRIIPVTRVYPPPSLPIQKYSDSPAPGRVFIGSWCFKSNGAKRSICQFVDKFRNVIIDRQLYGNNVWVRTGLLMYWQMRVISGGAVCQTDTAIPIFPSTAAANKTHR